MQKKEKIGEGETSGKKEKAEGEKKKEESRKRKFQERKEEAEKKKLEASSTKEFYRSYLGSLKGNFCFV